MVLVCGGGLGYRVVFVLILPFSFKHIYIYMYIIYIVEASDTSLKRSFFKKQKLALAMRSSTVHIMIFMTFELW